MVEQKILYQLTNSGLVILHSILRYNGIHKLPMFPVQLIDDDLKLDILQALFHILELKNVRGNVKGAYE